MNLEMQQQRQQENSKNLQKKMEKQLKRINALFMRQHERDYEILINRQKIKIIKLITKEMTNPFATDSNQISFLWGLMIGMIAVLLIENWNIKKNYVKKTT